MSVHAMNEDSFRELRRLYNEIDNYDQELLIPTNFFVWGSCVVSVIAIASLVFGACLAVPPLFIVAAACAGIGMVFFAIQIYRLYDERNKVKSLEDRCAVWKEDVICVQNDDYTKWIKNFCDTELSHDSGGLLMLRLTNHPDDLTVEISRALFNLCPVHGINEL